MPEILEMRHVDDKSRCIKFGLLCILMFCHLFDCSDLDRLSLLGELNAHMFICMVGILKRGKH